MKYIRNLFRDTTNSNINYDKTYILSFISPNIIEKIRLNQKLYRILYFYLIHYHKLMVNR